MRLSERMKNILEALREKKKDVPDKEPLKELLKKQEKKTMERCAKLGTRYGGPLSGEGITDEYVEKEQRKRSSVTQKELIVWFEIDEVDEDAFDRSKDELSKYTDSWISWRHSKSLPEYIAGHYWPKGRMWANNVYAAGFKGYEEAKKKANSLNASYSRTLNRMVELDLIVKEEFEYWKRSGYWITEKGQEAIDKC